MGYKETLELRGIKRVSILEYFEEQRDSELKTCQVTLSEEKTVHVGSLSFPEVTLIIQGERDLVIKIVSRFRLNFLSAGG